MGTLFIVGTPIGNLSDITFRAIETLKSVDCIFCERIVHAKKLLNHYEIKTPVRTYASFTPHREVNRAINLLREDKDIALISDAGTPTISDPGVRMVKAIYDELGSEASVISIPGACALISALSCSGAPASNFVFWGFPPKKHGRQKLFSSIPKETTAMYESPHRLMKTLEAISIHLEPQREVIVAREITKIYESYTRGDIFEVIEHFKNNPREVKGECVIILSSLTLRETDKTDIL